jgi:hypothetical protein
VEPARLAMPDPLAAGGEGSSLNLPECLAGNDGPRATLKMAMSAETGGNGDGRSTIAKNGERRRRGSAGAAMVDPLATGGEAVPRFEFVHGDLSAKFALFMGRGLRRKTRFSRGDQEEEGCWVALPIKLAMARQSC